MSTDLDIAASLRQALNKAQDDSNPLVDRVRWLSQMGFTIDEFFAGLVTGKGSHPDVKDIAQAVLPVETNGLRAEIIRVMDQAVNCFHNSIEPALRTRGIYIRSYAELPAPQQRRVDKFFRETALPVLTPLGFDPGRPFPRISNLSVNLALLIRDKQGRKRFARLKVPEGLPQLLRVDGKPENAGGTTEQTFIWLEDLITANLAELFPGLDVVRAHPFRIIRGKEIALGAMPNGRKTAEKSLYRNRCGRVVQLQIGRQMPASMLQILTRNLEVRPSGVYRLDGFVSLSRLSHVAVIDVHTPKNAPRAERGPLSLSA
jgi:polyphosphate kinase